MALIDFKFKPGIDKQNTSVGAENSWVDSDNVRFRYGLPEKVGDCALGPTGSKGLILKLPPVDTVAPALLDCVIVNVPVVGTVIT